MSCFEGGCILACVTETGRQCSSCCNPNKCKISAPKLNEIVLERCRIARDAIQIGTRRSWPYGRPNFSSATIRSEKFPFLLTYTRSFTGRCGNPQCRNGREGGFLFPRRAQTLLREARSSPGLQGPKRSQNEPLFKSVPTRVTFSLLADYI
jgi:hypothetical protein